MLTPVRDTVSLIPRISQFNYNFDVIISVTNHTLLILSLRDSPGSSFCVRLTMVVILNVQYPTTSESHQRGGALGGVVVGGVIAVITDPLWNP